MGNNLKDSLFPPFFGAEEDREEDQFSVLNEQFGQYSVQPPNKEIQKEITKLLEAGIIYPISDSKWVSPVHVVPKKGGITVIENEKGETITKRIESGWRMCIDYRKLNKATRKDHFPLPFIDQMLERLAKHSHFCYLDGYSGFFQIPIHPDDQEKTTFTCPFGTFAYRRMPFGLCNAPATFQRCMMAIFADFLENIMEVFMDDFSVYGQSFEECLENLERVLERCVKVNLVLNWEKCHFMVQEGIVLGHIISNRGIEVDKAKIEVIENLQPPRTVREVRSFLGHAGFYRRFIKDFSKITKPLTGLLMKDAEFIFDDNCLKAFQTLKQALISAPIMQTPDWNEPFEIMCDASDYAVGAVLGQRKDKKLHVIYYKEITKLLEAGIIYPISDSKWVSPVHVVPKKGGITVIENEKGETITKRIESGWRMCIDYRKLNKATRKDHFPLPFIDQMLERLAKHSHFCYLDGYSGFFQIPIHPDDQEKTTFTCPFGTFAYRRMPFGLCNAPATFQRCMMAIFADFLENIMEVFMDDFSVYGQSFEECLENLERVLERCVKVNLVLNWEKCHFMVQEGIVLGHIISNRGIEVDKAKIEVIENLQPPRTVREVRSFLGHAGFYRRFIKDFSKITKPLTGLLMKDAEFIFDDNCLKAFQTLKQALISAPIMQTPDWNEPFEIMCDASDYAVGAVLGQRKDKKLHVIYYASRTLDVVRRRGADGRIPVRTLDRDAYSSTAEPTGYPGGPYDTSLLEIGPKKELKVAGHGLKLTSRVPLALPPQMESWCWIHEYFPTVGKRGENWKPADNCGLPRAMRWSYKQGVLKVDDLRPILEELTPADVIWRPFEDHRA
ncbi:uncharacterized protein LOC127094142 [Lathyrus oleraceus]|uniref:uncharacterized protein LOC127094142 n=1 Tax=Pisum sativum TaxID=3888 RepID=UPI0021CE1546|nr:uncharacterized protein LOC127094142 [Pisum sativum]